MTILKECSAVVICLVLFAGCVTVSPTVEEPVSDCHDFWQSMENAIAREGVADGSSVRIDGYKYLRTNRFFEALGAQAETSREKRVLIEKMRQLDLLYRYQELEFLADESWGDFISQGYTDDVGVFKRQVASCSADFMQADRKDLRYFDHVMQAMDVDQDYSTLYRTLGLYPLTKLIVQQRIDVYNEDHPVLVETDVETSSLVLAPPGGRKLSARRIQTLLKNSRLKPFLDFQFKEQSRSDLVRFYAPSFLMGGDSFGRVVASEAEGWEVDDQDPVVYYYLSETLLQSIPALQINYVVWFNERRKPAPWYTQGHLDGLTFRVTLDWQGRPVVFDSIGNCGCFYFSLINDRVAEVVQSDDHLVPPFAGSLPQLSATRHLNVKIAEGSNGVTRISTTDVQDDTLKYTLAPYEELEQYQPRVPLKFFDTMGMVADTSRFESYFLFPMGIPNVGAMRQRGRQPISLIGRLYFDDPHLFDTVLRVKDPLPKTNRLVKKKKKQSSLKRRVESNKAMQQNNQGNKAKYFRKKGMGM